MKRYKHWEVVDAIPEGWVTDSTAGSPLSGHIFITNGKSVLNGQERALLKVKTHLAKAVTAQNHEPPDSVSKPKKAPQVINENYVRTVNDLARAKFKERILNDIMVDLMICEIEGWDKMEYIKEIKSLIDSIGVSYDQYMEQRNDV